MVKLQKYKTTQPVTLADGFTRKSIFYFKERAMTTLEFDTEFEKIRNEIMRSYDGQPSSEREEYTLKAVGSVALTLKEQYDFFAEQNIPFGD